MQVLIKCLSYALLSIQLHRYRKGFEIQPNEYAGINLATLMVISGKEFSTCSELKRIGESVWFIFGKKYILKDKCVNVLSASLCNSL